MSVSFCVEQACNNFAEPNKLRCTEHRRRHENTWNKEHRDADQKKFYNSAAWKKFRLRRLAKQPICVWPNCSQAATDVDHIVPLQKGGDPLTDANTQCLCKSHHAIKTRTEQ